MQKSKITLTRQQAIDDIVNEIDNWDMDRLSDYVKYHYTEWLEKCSIQDLETEYAAEFSILDSDDEELEILDTKATKLLFDRKGK